MAALDSHPSSKVIYDFLHTGTNLSKIMLLGAEDVDESNGTSLTFERRDLSLPGLLDGALVALSLPAVAKST